MRQESAGVTEALLDSARREFMEHGFHGASLRRIFLSMWFAVPVGSIFMRSCHINFLLKKHRCLWTT